LTLPLKGEGGSGELGTSWSNSPKGRDGPLKTAKSSGFDAEKINSDPGGGHLVEKRKAFSKTITLSIVGDEPWKKGKDKVNEEQGWCLQLTGGDFLF